MQPSALRPTRETLILLARAVAVGVAGAVLATLIGLPLPWMLGPLLACAAVSMADVRLQVPSPVRFAARGVIGVLLGSALDHQVLERIGQWPLSLAILIAGMVVIIALVSLYYRLAARFDTLTAVASSLPGGLSGITVIAIQLGAEPTRTVTAQLLRISLVVLLVPPLYVGLLGAEATAGGPPGPAGDWRGAGLWVLLLAPLAWHLGRLVRLPVPEMLGPMILAAGLRLAGVAITLPPWLFAVTFLALGSAIGARFHGLGGPRRLLPLGGHGLVATALIFLGAFGLALVIHAATGVPLPVALLAVIPGGIAEMAMLAAALGVDPLFVTFHQLVRSVLLNSLAPLILPWIGRRTGARAGE